MTSSNSSSWLRMTLGALQITALRDGGSALPLEMLKGIDREEAIRLLGSADPVPVSTNAFVVDTPGHRILVDAGRPGGGVPGALAEAGIPPDSVDAILLTHLHPDHFGALLTPGGQRAFPRAQVRVAASELAYWEDPVLQASAPEARRPLFETLRAAREAYGQDWVTFEPGGEVWPGVETLALPGHTPGHTAFLFGEGRESFWAVADVVHFGRIQFARPEVAVGFDIDPVAAPESRRRLLGEAAASGALLGMTHLAFPGLGRVRVGEGGFFWEPFRS
nr:MBL fold metallo-hydrolase [uncultured Holophaga sp.]